MKQCSVDRRSEDLIKVRKMGSSLAIQHLSLAIGDVSPFVLSTAHLCSEEALMEWSGGLMLSLDPVLNA